MLSLERLSLRLSSSENAPVLLSDISGRFQRGDFVAIIGPSGCGKSTLIKMIAGIATGMEEGVILWDGRDLAKEDFKPSEIGYVPQFSIAYDELTVEESIDYSARLRVAKQKSGERKEMVSRLLEEVGMSEFRDRPVKVLSGGQKRRLSLAMELVSGPSILLCDEVTSGLDPQAEQEIVELLGRVAKEGGRLVFSVTHSLMHLSSYTKVMVLTKGVLAYEGNPEYLSHYFRVDDPNQVYSQLNTRDAEGWQASWKKHAVAFIESMEVSGMKPMLIPCDVCGALSPRTTMFCKICSSLIGHGADDLHPPATKKMEHRKSLLPVPSVLSQFLTLTQRRFCIFFRSYAQLWLQVGLVFGFPFVVALFGWNGLPQIHNLSMAIDLNVVQELTESRDFLVQASKVGSLVSGIVMFEVILLTLMGANNSGREIAAERPIFEKEKLSGLSVTAYVASKIFFLGLLAAVQSLWMGYFIHTTCSFPGNIKDQLLFLFLVNAAMTSICLAISSFMKTAEQASLASIYLVGFQLPLSGAVLALPTWLGFVVKPFIAAYWSWSAMLQTMRGERYYDIARMIVQTGLAADKICLWVLGIHIAAGVLITYQGCTKRQIE